MEFFVNSYQLLAISWFYKKVQSQIFNRDWNTNMISREMALSELAIFRYFTGYKTATLVKQEPVNGVFL